MPSSERELYLFTSCISYLAGGKIFGWEFFFSSACRYFFDIWDFFWQIFWHKRKFSTFSMYFSSRAKQGTKYTSKILRIYASVEIIAEKSWNCWKSQDRHEKKKNPKQKLSHRPNTKCNDVGNFPSFLIFLIFPGGQIFPLVFLAGGYFLIRPPNKEISARREDIRLPNKKMDELGKREKSSKMMENLYLPVSLGSGHMALKHQ